ncbi:MAG: M23 family metallopeptidase [Anaerolineales bacterium]
MAAFRFRVGGAPSSEPTQHRRATGTAAAITLAGALWLVGVAEGGPTEADQQLVPASFPSASSVNELGTQSRRSTHGNFEAPSISVQSEPALARPRPRLAFDRDEYLAMWMEQRLERDEEFVATPLTFPDSEVVYSQGAMEFDIERFVTDKGGFLKVYREQIAGHWMTGAEIVERVAQNHSINPRLLLAIIEHQSRWVSDPVRPPEGPFHFPIVASDRRLQGLYLQLTWTADVLSRGYYGWRQDSYTAELSEDRPNAGTEAIRQLSMRLCSNAECRNDLIGTYYGLFGDPWKFGVEIHEENLFQPQLILPFPRNNEWVLTGGPHAAWGSESPWAALDFAPKWDSSRQTSDMEVVAIADSTVARVDHGILVLDLDGDGYEQTGWSIFYLHIAAADWVRVGARVNQGQIIGEASSAGGVADGDHLHIARKYNGEWIPVVGPVPLNLSGWRVHSGASEYDGGLYMEGRGCTLTVLVGDSLHPSLFQECRSEDLA